MAAYDITPEAKAAIIEQRLQQFAAEKFQHELNRDVAVAVNNTEAAVNADNAIAQLDVAIAVHIDQLNKIEGAPDA